MRSYEEADAAITNGTAKRYETFGDILSEIDDEITTEKQ